MQVTLPDGATAELISHDEITERIFRPIDRAKTKMMNVSVGLLEKGYSPPESWPDDLPQEEIESRNLKNLGISTDVSDADQDAMDSYTTALVLGITKSWSYETPITEDSLLDLKKPVLDFLAVECGKVFDDTTLDLSPAPNPEALASDSTV